MHANTTRQRIAGAFKIKTFFCLHQALRECCGCKHRRELGVLCVHQGFANNKSSACREFRIQFSLVIVSSVLSGQSSTSAFDDAVAAILLSMMPDLAVGGPRDA